MPDQQKQLTGIEKLREADRQALKAAKALRIPSGKPHTALKRLRADLRAAIQRLTDRIARLRAAIAQSQHSPALTMFDDVTVSLIPTDAKAAAGYVNGNYTTWPQIKAGPWPYKLSIAVNASADARCLDVEPGDATPADAPAWFKRQTPAAKSVIYCSVSQGDSVIAAMAAAGIARSQFKLWTAHYTGTPHRCTNSCYSGFHGTADATQYTDRALGRSLDASSVAPGFFS